MHSRPTTGDSPFSRRVGATARRIARGKVVRAMTVVVVTVRATAVLVVMIVVPTALPGAVLVDLMGAVPMAADPIEEAPPVIGADLMALLAARALEVQTADLVVDRADQVVLIGLVATVQVVDRALAAPAAQVAQVALNSGWIKLTASSTKSSARLPS